MEPAKKRIFLNDVAEKYKSLDPAQKQELLSTKGAKYTLMGPKQKQELHSKKAERYISMDAKQKQELHSKKAERYISMGPAQKQELQSKNAERYRSLDLNHKEALLHRTKQKYDGIEVSVKRQRLDYMKSKYNTMDADKKVVRLAKQREARRTAKNTLPSNLDYYLVVFQKKIKEGPYYICSVCNRILYRKSVVEMKRIKYRIQDIFTEKKSFDQKEYICKTCHLKVLEGKVPCQAVSNNLCSDEIPPELALLEKLEQVLIAQRTIFERVVVMPKGQQRKIKGAICNVPVDCEHTCRILPRPPERSGIIMLKLKRKLEFRGLVYFQAVRPQLIHAALIWLQMNNPLYRNIAIDITNIDSMLTNLEQTEDLNSNSSDVEGSPVHRTSETEVLDDIPEEKDDPLNEHRAPTNETCLQSVIPDYPIIMDHQNENSVSVGNEIYNVAPGEKKHPVSLMTDKQCEELSFPVLFPKGRFGYTAQRDIKFTPVKYFNARLLHFSGRFATNPEYLFYARFIMEQKKVSDSINIALQKVHGQSIRASELRSNAQSLQNLISKDQAYLFPRHIPRSPPYWQRFMYEVVAMVQQLGIHYLDNP